MSEFQRVLKQAQGFCQCEHGKPGACGSDTHRGTGRRCYEQAKPHRPLVVAPVDPEAPLHVAATLRADGLLVMCQPCLTRRTTGVKNAHAAARAAAAPGLFSDEEVRA
ncbi:hypothetical protein [Streptomyces sp. NPDC059063]|uniref:hypothetical protein n=1 Tax=unclassified Streptomyces TaxID=2593676 RepID=UPI0036A02102